MKKMLMILPMALSLSVPPVMANSDTQISKEYVSYCEEIGMERHVCPELLEAIIESESSGQPDATNGPCRGLMQVNANYHTARMQRLGVTDIYDPRGNISVGCDILVELFETYGDNIQKVLMLYNGSQNAIERANRLDFSEYAEKITERSTELERAHGK